jgi:tryptophanyl-tRNA synthetase
MRPTGRLHIGHYFGALQNWVRLQNDPTYDCFYFIADWHALTSDYADTSAVAQNTIEIMTDYLAAGLDPKKSVIFLQSLVPEHSELHLLLSMITPLGWLERVPTYKEALENVSNKDLHTYGFLGYPVLQTADIVIYGGEGTPLVVPVGEDQKSHVELSREIVRSFNNYYSFKIREELSRNPEAILAIFRDIGVLPPFLKGSVDESSIQTALQIIRQHASEDGYVNFLNRISKINRAFFEILPPRLREPEVMLTQTPKIPGTDGRKMSKSYGNTISLSEMDESIWQKIRPMKTDPARQRRENPGNPDICPVYDWHKLFSPPATLNWAAQGCRTAAIGCIDCKRAMSDNLIKWIAPIRERRLHYQDKEKLVRRIIQEGSAQARVIAQETMMQVRDAVLGNDRIRRRNLRPRRKASAG